MYRPTLTVSGLALAVMALMAVSCSFGVGISNTGFAAYWTLIDLRIGNKTAAAGDVALSSDKEAMSKQQATMWEEMVPDIAAAVVEAIKPTILKGQQCQVPRTLGDEVTYGPVQWTIPATDAEAGKGNTRGDPGPVR